MGHYARLTEVLRAIHECEMAKREPDEALDELVFTAVAALNNAIDHDDGVSAVYPGDLSSPIECALVLERRRAFIRKENELDRIEAKARAEGAFTKALDAVRFSRKYREG